VLHCSKSSCSHSSRPEGHCIQLLQLENYSLPIWNALAAACSAAHPAEFSDDGEDVSDEEEGEEVTSPPPFKTSTAGAQAAAVTPAPAQHYGNGLLQPSPASAGFAVTTPAAHAAAGTPGTGGGAVPAGGRVLRIKHDSPGAPVRISLHLERQVST
jgi:hypothetical protein